MITVKNSLIGLSLILGASLFAQDRQEGWIIRQTEQGMVKVPAKQFFRFEGLNLNGKAYTQSSAVLEIFRLLGFPWKLLYVFKILPPVIRNFLYNLLARYRYKWFAKRDSCMMPDDKLKERFID